MPLDSSYNFYMPRAPKEKEKPAPVPKEEELESGELELSSNSIEKQARETFSDSFYRSIKKIAYYTSKIGLPLNEACVLVDIEYEWFVEKMKTTPLIRKIIIMKELEFKRDMLNTITQRARSGDEKLAQWLLERKFPDEYGNKKTAPQDGGDVIFEAIKFIRKTGTLSPMVDERSGAGIVPSRTAEALPLEDRIDDILSSPMPTLPCAKVHDV